MIDKKWSFGRIFLLPCLLIISTYIIFWNIVNLYKLNKLEKYGFDEIEPSTDHSSHHDFKCYPASFETDLVVDEVKIPKCSERPTVEHYPFNTLVENVWIEKGKLRIKGFPKSNTTALRCSLLPIRRVNDFMSIYEESIENVHDGYSVQTPMFKVICQPRENLDLLADTRWNDKALSMQQVFYICGSYPVESRQVKPTSHGFNVLLLGLDSVSQRAARVYLNKTMTLLQSLNAITFNLYNIIGDGTTANLLALLTGLLESDLPEARKSHMSEPSSKNVNTTVLDNYPWLWKLFSQRGGYATHFIEDSPRWGTFQNRLVGFGSRTTPTDQYGRTCLLAAYQEEQFVDKILGCTGQRFTHHVLIESMIEFFSAYHPRPRFSLTFLSELFHENVAYVQMLDDDLVKLITRIDSDDRLGGEQENTSDHILANTILVLFADHGPRMGKIRQSIEGKLQERLPLLSIYLPRKFRSNWPEAVNNLNLNRDKLVTLFDVHATLVDLLKRQSSDVYDRESQVSDNPTNGQSLFEPVLEYRSCANAHIQPHWCVCLQWDSLADSVNGPRINTFLTKLAKQVVDHINSLLRKYPQCAQYRLSRVIQAERALYPRQVVRFQQSLDPDGRIPVFSDDLPTQPYALPGWLTKIRLNQESITPYKGHMYRIYMVVEPGPAHFEMIGNLDSGRDNDLEIQQISRLDLYEPMASCILESNSPEMRQYCVCIQPNQDDAIHAQEES